MKSNEVRVGNFILFSGVQTRVIPADFATQCRGINSSEMPNFNPIELTEEWLKKAGYKKQNGYGYSNYNVYGTILKNETGFEFHYYGIIIRLDFVHQLQNLFFSLYGEDLVFSTEP